MWMIELISDQPDRVVCRPVGELDAYSVGQFRQVISEVSRSGVALKIDLMLLTFIDLTGARAIQTAARYVSRQGTRTRVVGGSEAVRRMMDLVDSCSSPAPIRALRPSFDDPGPSAC
jgi:anti-anti-sigma factor